MLTSPPVLLIPQIQVTSKLAGRAWKVPTGSFSWVGWASREKPSPMYGVRLHWRAPVQRGPDHLQAAGRLVSQVCGKTCLARVMRLQATRDKRSAHAGRTGVKSRWITYFELMDAQYVAVTAIKWRIEALTEAEMAGHLE